MAVATDYSGWVKELDHYEASLAGDDDGDPRIEGPAATRRGMSLRAGIGTGRKGKPRQTSVAEELEQEMKLLNWHKLANEAALKAAIIKTNKIKGEDSRFASSLANEDGEDKRQRIQQIIEEEQLKPLQVNTEFFREFEAREQRDAVKVENDVQRHIQHLKKLKESMAQREDVQRRRQRYKEGMAELGGVPKSLSVPKGHKSNQDEELSVHNKRYMRSMSTAHKSEVETAEVICSLDKLMELEKRIRHLEDAGLGVEGLEGGNGGTSLEDIDDNNVTSTKNIRFAKRKSAAASSEPSKTVYAVKTVTKVRAKDPLRSSSVSPSKASNAARKRALSKPKPPQTFITSLPENKQKQLRRMTERERRNFLKTEKAAEVKQQQLKQDVVIHDWMQKKKQAAQQRKTTTTMAAPASGGGMTRRGAGKPLPPPPQVRPPLRGAAAGKHIANPHLQKFDDIRRGLEKRKEMMGKQPTTKSSGGNKVLELRTIVNERHQKKPASHAAAATTRAAIAKLPAAPPASRVIPSATTLPTTYQRRQSGDAARLPAISRAPPMPSLSQAPSVGPSTRLTLPRLNGVRTPFAMPSPPPAAAKNPSMPQFSRLQKR